MITITIYRKKLVELGACTGGLVVFDDIMRAQGRKKSVRVRDWTPLHSAWLDAVYPTFATWLFDHNLLHSTSTSGDYGTSTSGECGRSTSGDRGTSTSGYLGRSTSGYLGRSTSGDRGVSTSGGRGTSTTGICGTVVSGDYGIIVCQWYDGVRDRLTVGYVGENGVLPNVAYMSDGEGNLMRAR